MPIPLRVRNLRVSVQALVESKTGGWAEQRFEHSFWYRMDLVPMSGEQVARFSGAGYDANWKGAGRNDPLIPDGAQLVVYEGDVGKNDAPPEAGAVRRLVFEVKKALPRGRFQEILLKEMESGQTDQFDVPPTGPDPVPIRPPAW